RAKVPGKIGKPPHDKQEYNMLNFIVYFIVFVVACGLIAAYAYLIVISRENDLPDFEDVEIGSEENRVG
ncbi:MAG: hypothetical protein WCD88_07635, partial [Desulfobacterales bacterium]